MIEFQSDIPNCENSDIHSTYNGKNLCAGQFCHENYQCQTGCCEGNYCASSLDICTEAFITEFIVYALLCGLIVFCMIMGARISHRNR